MATGSLVGSTCLDNVSLAADSYFSSLPVVTFPAVVNGVSGSYVSSFQFVSPDWVNVISQQTLNGLSPVSSAVAAAPNFASCYSSTEAFSDGVSAGWAFAGVLTIVLFVSVAKRLFNA